MPHAAPFAEKATLLIICPSTLVMKQDAEVPNAHGSGSALIKSIDYMQAKKATSLI